MIDDIKLLRNQVAYLEASLNGSNLPQTYSELCSDPTVDNLTGYFAIQDGRFVFTNQRFAQIFGYTMEEIMSKEYLMEMIHPDDQYLLAHNVELLLLGKETSVDFHIRGLSKDGNTIFLQILGASRLFHSKRIIYGDIFDVTTKIMAEEALRISEERYRGIVEDQTELICRRSPDRTLTFVNEAFCRYFKKSRDELLGQPFEPPIYQEDEPVVHKHLSALSPEKPLIEYIHRIINTDGQIRWLEWSERAFFGDNNVPTEIQSVGRDITEKKVMEEELRYLNLHDSLTDLYNRTYFEEEMRRLEDGRYDPMGLIICDVDGLKLVNDSYGHDSGDTVLARAAQLIKTCFRTGDVIARVGSDEFAILLPKTTRASSEEACERIRSVVGQHNVVHPDLVITVSTGLAVRDGDTRTMADLFKEADDNMQRAKLHSTRSSKSSIVSTLLKALEARDFITEGHAGRMERLIVCIAETIGVQEYSLTDLRLLAQFHDLGKVGVPDGILFKPAHLTPEEYREMQRHCEIGYRIALTSPELTPIADWILKHHEWWNGKGYPLGLKGRDIPLECRILAIVDAYDAMTTDRPYRKAMTHEQAVAEILRCTGTQFDPHLVPLFMKVSEEKRPTLQ
ncbi:MAG: diguanylate cyclase domain-containing protein [Candidatus Saccharibacteria bacterium]